MKSVHKFDGRCLIDVATVRRAAERVAPPPTVVVVAALSGTTDALAAVLDAAEAGAEARADETMVAIWDRHLGLARALGADETGLHAVWAPVPALVRAVGAVGHASARSRDRLLATGERMSAILFAAALRAMGRAVAVRDASQFIFTDDRFGSATPLRAVTERAARAALEPDLRAGVTPVVPGFVGRAPDGATTTLGRSGSDLTATTVAAALAADEVILWTDADGLLSGPPGVVRNPAALPHLHYREAAEMSFYGTRLLHPRAMIPAQGAGLSVRVKCLDDPDAPGTTVDGRFSGEERPVKAVRAVREQALLSVEGKGMAGVVGVSGRVLTALGADAISATMISQTGSEASICLAVDKQRAEAGAMAVRRALRAELSRGEIEEVGVRRHAGLVAIVGMGMAHRPGVAATAMVALAEAGINILALAQGSSEVNITIAVDERDVDEALRRLHDAFALGAAGDGAAAGSPSVAKSTERAWEGGAPGAHGRATTDGTVGSAALRSAPAAAPRTPDLRVPAGTTPDLRPAVESGTGPSPGARAPTSAGGAPPAEVGSTLVSVAPADLDVVTAFAPATVANLGLGFDILGLALGDAGDRVVARRVETPGVTVAAVFGDGGRLPRGVDENSAGVAAKATMAAAGIEIGVALELHKGLPLGSGLGSSAASAAAAAVAVNALMGNPLRPVELIPPCVEAEAAVSAAHADNVAPSLLGGLVLIRALTPLDVIRLPLPRDLTVAVVTPDIEVNTRASRQVLPASVSLPSLVRWTANIAALTCACFTGDLDLMARCITEDEVTASRATLIPGCREVIAAARDAGCLGSSISGSGPSVFALCRSLEDGRRVAEAMAAVFAAHGLTSVQRVSLAECPGARVL